MTEFNLSEKRKELRWQIDKRKEKEAMSLLLDATEKQDKESVKELKEKFCKNFELGGWICVDNNRGRTCDNCKDINEIFGKDLI